MTYVAAIDIGTHSALLLIATLANNQLTPEVDLACTTKLGDRLPRTGAISPAAMDRLLIVLSRYEAILSEYPIAHLTVFGTAVFRQASNARDCIALIQRKLGWPLRVLTKKEEATYTFIGLTQGLAELQPESFPQSDERPLIALDIGGGSTEIILGTATAMEAQWSLPLGALGLKQQLELGDPLSAAEITAIRAVLAPHLAPIAWPASARVIVTGGTATTVAALQLGLIDYDGQRIQGHRCSLDDLTMLLEELNRISLSQRADLPGMEPGRADVILPALVLLLAVLDDAQAQGITISVQGVRYGTLRHWIAQ
ncbi:MAG: hypothetical protein HC922_00880 [Leptolyngbyaceae cyanobacterium SM2_3_12]|nr:hypothetical protein [Leptolyngbyaceae cyanobacterium SM2_3_12]